MLVNVCPVLETDLDFDVCDVLEHAANIILLVLGVCDVLHLIANIFLLTA